MCLELHTIFQMCFFFLWGLGLDTGSAAALENWCICAVRPYAALCNLQSGGIWYSGLSPDWKDPPLHCVETLFHWTELVLVGTERGSLLVS